MMEEEIEVAVEKTESVPENTDIAETKKKGARGQGRGQGGKGYVRGKMRGKALNGFGPVRRGMGRMRPYPDIRGRRGARGRPLFPPSLPMRGMMRVPFLPPPPRYRFPLPPPPSGPMNFRGRPPPLGARGMPPSPQGPFPRPRGVT
ncbi:PREDICTED: formin-like protein 20 [Gekko japonicus]|uniref:Formin-like protein 20 n=1 Tax=Gekko japonicus TaxID=146911 RepID=A0ABM1JYR1_GEKJA|nr:PREDICTED: formin-like protein 20 [Gekko japonicus]